MRASQATKPRRQRESFTSSANAAKRARRRNEAGLPGYASPEIPWMTALSEPPPPVPGDAAAYVELQRNAWLAEVEHNARLTLPKERAELFLKLLKLTSLHRVRVDVSARLDRLQPEPNLTQLTDAQLDRLLADGAIETEALPKP